MYPFEPQIHMNCVWLANQCHSGTLVTIPKSFLGLAYIVPPHIAAGIGETLPLPAGFLQRTMFQTAADKCSKQPSSGDLCFSLSYSYLSSVSTSFPPHIAILNLTMFMNIWNYVSGILEFQLHHSHKKEQRVHFFEQSIHAWDMCPSSYMIAKWFL